MAKLTHVLLLFLLVQPLFGQAPGDAIRLQEKSRFAGGMSAVLAGPHDPRPSFDVKYYRLEIQVFPESATIQGRLTMRANSQTSELRQVTLDLVDNLSVHSVESGQAPLAFVHQNDEIEIELASARQPGETFEIDIAYSGAPDNRSGGLASFDFGEHKGAPIISTLSEPFGARAWWPSKDHPADKADSVDIVVTAPADLTVASNGLLADVHDNGDGTKTWFWQERYPIATYLVSLAISNYVTFHDIYHISDTDSMRVEYYVYPEHYQQALEDFNVTVPMLEFYSSVFGPYPFAREKYGMAEFPWGGAMEHQTCTSYGSNLIRGNHQYDRVIAHELSHQWFGDLITMRNWSEIWLNEGFATYSEALWLEHVRGKATYFSFMRGLDLVSYGRNDFPVSVFVRDSSNVSSLFSETVYNKGGWVLHMLRWVIGDSAFFSSLKDYCVLFPYGNATTRNFQAICEHNSGMDLSRFFGQWVFGIYRPRYEYWWTTSQEEAKQAVLYIRQAQQNTGLFEMPLQVRWTTATGDTDFVVWDSLGLQAFHFELDAPALAVSVDPDGWVLKYLEEVSGPGNDDPEDVEPLSHNYPNPFNDETVIFYQVAENDRAVLEVFDILGRRVRVLFEGIASQSYNFVVWDGRNDSRQQVSSGVYFYRLLVNGARRSVRKMLLIR